MLTFSMKRPSWPASATLVLALLLASCGGGGGGGSEPTTPGLALSFDRTAINEVMSSKLPVTFRVTATINQVPDQLVYIVITDTAGLFGINGIPVTANSLTSYTAVLSPGGAPAPGHYVGNLTVDLCFDAGCSSKATETTLLPYDVTVLGESTDKILGSIPGFSSWIGYQANAEHTGYVPVSVAPASAVIRWVINNPGSEYRSSTYAMIKAAEGEKLYAQIGEMLVGFSEQDGTRSWQYSPGYILNAFNYELLLTQGGLLAYMYGYSDNFGVNAFVSLDKQSAAKNFQIDVENNWLAYGLAADDTNFYYGSSSSLGSVNVRSLASGDVVDSQNAPAGVGFYSSPVFVGSSLLYNGVDNNDDQVLVSLSPATNESSTLVTNTGVRNNAVMQVISPMKLADNNVVALSAPNAEGDNYVSSFDPTLMTKRWSFAGKYEVALASAAGVVYAANNKNHRLEARNAATGALLWSWTLPASDVSSFTGNVVVTDSHVFVTSNRHLYSISLTTRSVDFSFCFYSFYQTGRASLILSPARVLYLSVGTDENYDLYNHLVAFDLN